jgi:hypothetical protein
MSDTSKMTYDPIPVGGPFGQAPVQAEAKPAFSRNTSEPVQTGGLLPPSRKPVSVTNTDKALPPGIAPESSTVPNAPAPNKGGLLWDMVKPTRGKGAVLAGLLSLGAGAYGLNLVVPQQPLPQAKVMSEPGKEPEAPARMPNLVIERGSAPVVEQVRTEPITLVSSSELPVPEKLPELPSSTPAMKLPDLPTAGSELPLPKADTAVPLPGSPALAMPEEKPIKDKPLPMPKIDPLPSVSKPDTDMKLAPPKDVLTPKKDAPLPMPAGDIPIPGGLPLPTDSIPGLPKVGTQTEEPFKTPPELELKPIKVEPPVEKKAIPPAREVKAPAPVVAPKLEEVKFDSIPAAPATLTTPIKTEVSSTPKTDYDEDIVRVRSGDTYATLAKAHYEDDRYAAALKEYNRGIDIGLTREIQVPPLYVLKKLARNTFDRFEPATRPVSATTPVISGPVMDAPIVKPDSSDMEWSKPGTPKRTPNFSILTTDRDGLTPKQLAKQVLGDAGEWRKLTDSRGQQFGEEEGLPKGTEVRYPKLQAEWR